MKPFYFENGILMIEDVKIVNPDVSPFQRLKRLLLRLVGRAPTHRSF